MTPTRGPDCPPAVTLEAFSAGDSQHVGTHVASCEACGTYVTSLRAQAEAFNRQRPAELFLKQVDAFMPAPPRRRWWRPALVLAFVTAAALLFALPRATTDVTLKGSALHVMRRTAAGDAEPLTTGTRVHAGDVVRLTFSAPHAGWLMVVQLDGTEAAVSRFAGLVEAGTTTLPNAVELDDSVGPEWFMAVWAPQPLQPETVLQQLSGQAKHARLSVACSDCRVEAVRLEKP